MDALKTIAEDSVKKEPVSYTHLDVYKRQLFNLFGIKRADCRF